MRLALGVNSISQPGDDLLVYGHIVGGHSVNISQVCDHCSVSLIMGGICPRCSGMEEEVFQPWKNL